MPPFTWPVNYAPLIQSFEIRHSSPEAGTLFFWAVRTMESLHYLDDVDQAYDTTHTVIGAHSLEEVLSWFSQAMGPTMAALYCAVGPDFVAKVIESGSQRWKAHHYQLMKKKPKRLQKHTQF